MNRVDPTAGSIRPLIQHGAWLAVFATFTTQIIAGGVFWTDRGTSQLKRMNFDGTAPQTISLSGAVTTAGTNIRGIAVDISGNRIYWADNGADRLLRASFNGSASTVLHMIEGGNSFPADVRLDLPNQFFYWCDQLRNVIQRSTLDGNSVVTVITNAAPTGPYFMDLDSTAAKIYWGDFDGGQIYRANNDGSSRETLITGNNKTRGVKIDPIEGILYWINRDDKKIHRCPLTAFTNGPISITHAAVQTLYSGLDTPHGLALDIRARKLYWADTGSNSGAGAGDKAVSRGDFDGISPMEVLATGSEPWDVDLDLRSASYSEWRSRCFRSDALPQRTTPNADPDGDGISNALEYAFNLSPLQRDLKSPAVLIHSHGTNSPTLMFRRRTATTDLTYTIQTSTNLVAWTSSADAPQISELSVVAREEGMEEVTARLVSMAGDRPVLFVRLSVELATPSVPARIARSKP
jgi:hypothetical protein